MPASPPTPPPGAFARKVRRILLLLPLAAVGLLLVWFVVFVLRSGAEVRRLEAAARARNEPLTLAEVAQTYAPIPDEENAAVPLLALWRSEDPEFWEAFDQGAKELPKPKVEQPVALVGDKNANRNPRAPLTREDREILERYVESRSPRMDQVRQGLAKASFRFPLRIEDGFSAHIPYLGRLRREAQEFAAEGWLAVERDDGVAARRAMEDCEKIGELLDDDPYLIGQMVRIACNSACLAQAERMVSRLELPDAELVRMEAILARLSASNGFGRALVSERAACQAVFDDPRTMPTTWKEDSPEDQDSQRFFSIAVTVGQAIGLKRADRLLYLGTIEKLITNTPVDTVEKWNAAELAVDNAVVAAEAFPPKLFSSIFLTPLLRVATRFCNLDAHRDAALTALAIERFRRAHEGALPKTLQQLVPTWLPKIPTDIFNGQPLRYRRLERGYVVYSVGPDRLDNGGRERPTKGPEILFDVTFTVER
jgi:hypothetical protein